MRISLTVLGAAVSSALPARAQQIPYGPARSYPVANLPGSNAASRMVAGDITGDLLPDLILVSQQQLYMLVNPGCMERLVTLPPGYTVLDVAVVDRDLAILTPTSILRGHYEPNVVEPHWTLAVAATAPSDAKRIRCVDLDGVGGRDLVVVGGANARTITRFTNAGNEFVAAGSFVLSYPVQDVVGAELDSDPEDELAILADNGLHLVQPDGTLIHWVRTWHTDGMAICLTRNLGGACKVLFTKYSIDRSSHLLLQVGAGGAEATYDLGNLHPAAITPGDYELDGDADVLLTQADSWTPLILINHSEVSGSADYSTAAGSCVPVSLFGMTLPTTVQPGNCCWIDSDFDGYRDVFLPVFGGEAVGGILSNIYPLAQQPLHPAFVHARYTTTMTTAPGRLLLDLALPSGTAWPEIELAVWEHIWNHQFVASPPISVTYTQAGSAVPESGDPSLDSAANYRIAMTMQPGDLNLPFCSHRRYYFTVRMVRRDVTSAAILASSQVWVGGWAGGNPTNPTLSPEIPPLNNDRQNGWAPILYHDLRSGDSLGLMVPMPAVPHFLPGID